MDIDEKDVFRNITKERLRLEILKTIFKFQQKDENMDLSNLDVIHVLTSIASKKSEV